MKQQDFDRRFDRLFGYIEQNLEGDLSVERLSQVACLSKFHFHRVFSSSYGLSIGKYLQLIKLKRAAYQLAFSPEYKIIDIAFDAGFETPGTFSRAFRHAFGLTPSLFRKKPDWTLWHERCSFKRIKRTRSMGVSVVDFPAVKVAVFEHRGPAEQVNATAKAFVQWRKDSGLSPRETCRTFGIVYDNPETTEPAAFRFDICGEGAVCGPACTAENDPRRQECRDPALWQP